MSYAVLQIPDFALQALQRTEAALAGRPVALLSDATKKAVVVEACAVARAAGVEAGFSAPQAMARCAGLELRVRSPSAEQEAEAVLLAVAWSLSPRVERTAPGTCTIDLQGRVPESNLLHGREALDRLRPHGLGATLGIARTPLLAGYAASTAVLALEVNDEPAFLAPLPVALAQPSPALAAILASWGIRTCGALTALPKGEVGRRLGAEGLALWERAAGLPDRPIQPAVPPEQFAAAMDLEHAVETLEPLLFVLRRCLDRLALQLGNAGMVADRVSLSLALVDETAHARDFRLPEPTAHPEIIFRALHTHLESLHTAAPVNGLKLAVVPTRPLARQRGLFETGLRDPHGFTETLARLGALLGADRVGTPAREATHRPDTFALEAPPALVAALPPPSVLPALGLPLRRFRPPYPARVEITAEGPVRVESHPARGFILRARGPWKGSGHWWKPEAWEREEWDVELTGGGLYRLVRLATRWFVEGLYD
ncbi:MAG TPA: DNA polymerase Y family protein [Opitutaceae bacterium]|nr:DNA polymerase Y family protein [Opitutaceae bacterium]